MPGGTGAERRRLRLGGGERRGPKNPPPGPPGPVAGDDVMPTGAGNRNWGRGDVMCTTWMMSCHLLGDVMSTTWVTSCHSLGDVMSTMWMTSCPLRFGSGRRCGLWMVACRVFSLKNTQIS